MKKLEIYVQKVNSTVDFIRLCQQIKQWFADKKDGCYKLALSQSRKDKTQPQLGAIFGLAVKQILKSFDDQGIDTSYLLKLDKPTGNPVSPELLKEYLYQVCPMFNDDGERITLSKSNTKQAAEFFESVRNYAASQWNIYIPDPNPNYKENENG